MGCGTARTLGESGKELRIGAIIAALHPWRCKARRWRLAETGQHKNRWEQRMGAGA